MDENCDCLLCQKRKLHPELTPPPVDRVELMQQIEAHVNAASEETLLAAFGEKPDRKTRLRQQIEEFAEFAEFAAERLDAARSELASKTAAGFYTTAPQLAPLTNWNFPVTTRLEDGNAHPLPSTDAWSLTADTETRGWTWTDNAYCRFTEIHIGFDDRRLIGAKMTRVQVEAADLMPLFHEVADKAAKEWAETHYNARVKLDPTTVDVFVVSPGAARERCIGCTLSVSHCCCEKPTKADAAPVDCRECGRVLGSPEEFMAHECESPAPVSGSLCAIEEEMRRNESAPFRDALARHRGKMSKTLLQLLAAEEKKDA